MKSKSSAPADTQMMGIVHDALRRDLTRTTNALLGQPAPHDVQRVAIAQHVQTMMKFLHVHHSGEDAWLWPTIRNLNPAASEILDQMDADHLAIAPHMTQVVAAAVAYQESANGRAALEQAISDLRGALDPHLSREENEMMPIVAKTLTAEQWDKWEQDYYIKTKTKKELGLEGNWLIDGADRAVYDHVIDKVNPVIRFVALHIFGPIYKQQCGRRWGAEVSIGPKISQVSSANQPEMIGSHRRPWRTHGEVSLHIEASPEHLYDLVADITAARTRSEEVQACLWLEGPPSGTVGSRFRGHNRAGVIRWSRVCEIVTAARGEAFAFQTVPERFDPTRKDSSIWGYRFEPENTGTRVVHYYSLVQPPQPLFLMLYGIFLSHHRDVRPAIKLTLERLKLTAESH